MKLKITTLTPDQRTDMASRLGIPLTWLPQQVFVAETEFGLRCFGGSIEEAVAMMDNAARRVRGLSPS